MTYTHNFGPAPIEGGTILLWGDTTTWCTLSPTKVLIIYQQSSPKYFFAQIVTLNGTSVPTYGAAEVFNSGEPTSTWLQSAKIQTSASPTTHKVVLHFTGSSSGSGYTFAQYYQIIDIDASDNITFGNKHTAPFLSGANVMSTIHSNQDNIFYQGGTDSTGDAVVWKGTAAGNTVSVVEDHEINGGINSDRYGTYAVPMEDGSIQFGNSYNETTSGGRAVVTNAGVVTSSTTNINPQYRDGGFHHLNNTGANDEIIFFAGNVLTFIDPLTGVKNESKSTITNYNPNIVTDYIKVDDNGTFLFVDQAPSTSASVAGSTKVVVMRWDYSDNTPTTLINANTPITLPSQIGWYFHNSFPSIQRRHKVFHKIDDSNIVAIGIVSDSGSKFSFSILTVGV